MGRNLIAARARTKSYLEDSWVGVSDGDDEITLAPGTTAARQTAPRKRTSRPTTRASAEPEFIMPSMHEGGAPRLEDRSPRSGRKAGSSTSSLKEHRPDDRVRTFPNLARSYGLHDQGHGDAMSYVRPVLSWVYDVLARTLHMLKTPISYLIVIGVLFGILVFLRYLFFSSLYSALSPVCRIPGASLLNLPMCRSPISLTYSDQDHPPVQFDQLMTVQNKFEEVLQEAATGVSLPLDMKRGETSIRDLRQVVRFSQLHSKNELVLEFDGFIETARIASYDLQKFNSHVGRGVDNILATARWTKRVLDGIAEREASQGALSYVFNNKMLAPFQPVKYREDALLDQYIRHTRTVENEINRLVVEAQALLSVLQNLEDRLDVIHGIAVRDNLHAQGGKDEVLSQLWTMLGGNRSKLGKFNSQLQLLGQVNTYRQEAIAHITATLVRLQSMGAEIEELRERVGSVELLEGRIPLSLHIENIEMGVERLERSRKGAKELENEELRKTLDRGKGNDRMIDGA